MHQMVFSERKLIKSACPSIQHTLSALTLNQLMPIYLSQVLISCPKYLLLSLSAQKQRPFPTLNSQLSAPLGFNLHV